ncbi:MAG: hypothetical protein RLZZ04_675, partial [Cyanobacteriota bacterium]
MKIWQADFYHHPSSSSNERQWALLICDSNCDSEGNSPDQNTNQIIKPIYTTQCLSSDANADWLEQQILLAA